MTAPASGLWGPGDYGDDFVTIDAGMAEARRQLALRISPWAAWNAALPTEMRRSVRDAILDMAEDLAGRGEELWTADEVASTIELIDVLGKFDTNIRVRNVLIAEFNTIACREPQPPSPEIPPPQNPS